MLEIQKKIIGTIVSIILVIVLCVLCFSFGKCSVNNRNRQLTQTLANLKESNTELNTKYNELRIYVKEAETERLIRKHQVKSQRSFNGLCFILNNLGKMMVNWGSFLQKRYEGISYNQCTQSGCKN